eukprot:gene11457-biopygen4861
MPSPRPRPPAPPQATSDCQSAPLPRHAIRCPVTPDVRDERVRGVAERDVRGPRGRGEGDAEVRGLCGLGEGEPGETEHARRARATPSHN